jgi:predicted ribosomally synthesized peptide with SipW-like signal peptide
MKRSILFSSLVIAAVLAVVAGASTFATFTDQASGSQTVTAGTVDVEVNNDTDDAFAITFGGASCTSPTNMAYGDSCTFTVNVKNAGSLSFTTSTTLTESNPTCFTSTFVLPNGDVEGGDADNDHDPADTHAVTLTTTLDNDAAACQGTSNLVSLTIDATQSPSPHD